VAAPLLSRHSSYPEARVQYETMRHVVALLDEFKSGLQSDASIAAPMFPFFGIGYGAPRDQTRPLLVWEDRNG
jgi:hypothetical protein